MLGRKRLLVDGCIATSVIFLAIVLASGAVLPTDEVDALREIGEAIGKNWDFNVDPCSRESGWTTTVTDTKALFQNVVNCTCTTVCHVTSIRLKTQDLAGTLPKNLFKLPYLIEIDLTRNFLNGSIPPEWGLTNLEIISLNANNLSGSLPKELANITTLEQLVVEYNQLSGPIPTEFGNFPSIQRLLLTSNNLTGELPRSLAKLSNLTDLRISDNQFSGRFPDFIGNWTNMKTLVIQGSGLTGPIAPGIASLTKLEALIISDLNGNGSTFPPLELAKSLETLFVRNCNITGRLPEYLGDVTELKRLDLSFNNFTGPIPNNWSRLSNTDYIYLTENELSGKIPDWMRTGGQIDLSYNNMTLDSASCRQSPKLNLFSRSANATDSVTPSCFKDITCPETRYGLHINCGGKDVRSNNGTEFEDDSEQGEAVKLFQGRPYWASSSTGHFFEDARPNRLYTVENTSVLSANDSQLYITARLSPLSLTYYGFCLHNGNYTVNLHFAEIMFANNKSYASLGRRIFDVYIQRKLVLKDFNIAEKAGGVNKEIIAPFTATVEDGTLEIRFYWAGKGTNAIPYKGVYGPLISAISVNPHFPVPVTKKGLSTGAIVGIVVGALFIILLILGLIWWKVFRTRKDPMDDDLRGLEHQTSSFTLRQIKLATNNFDPDNKIGEGGFGSVYKGVLPDGTIIAVKQLSSKSKQGNREFINEIGMISAIQHPNLVKLYGCCIESNQLLLVYEYMENNSLARALFGPEEFQIHLDWKTRHRICVGIARGLAYLHEESRLKIVHRDIKATNVLLDKNLDPKISDFGLAKLDEEESTHISTRVAGTYGYMAPEYAMHGHLTDKADVYSFGIVALEIVIGRSNTSIKPKDKDGFLNLLDWALVLKESGNLMDMIDPRLGTEFNLDEVMTMINVALLCTNVVSTARPSMSTVVSLLEGKTNVDAYMLDMSVSSVKSKRRVEFKDHSGLLSTSNSQIQSTIDLQWTDNSAVLSDLYPITPHTEYLEGRS